MEAIVLKVLKKYLKLFIKNFTADNFSLSLLKGEGQLVDLELNENVLQELLLIPAQLRVTQASCDVLTAKVPWTSYKKEPITISLNKIQIDLKEPEVITALQPQFKKFKKKNKNKRNEVTENLQVEAKNIKLSLSTMHGDSLIIEIEDVFVQSTNSNFQVVELSQIKTIDKDQGVESLHKLITAKSISIRVQDCGGMSYNIIEQMPLKVLYSTKRRIKDWIQLNAKVEFLLGFMNLRWNLSQWHFLADLFSQFQSILARAVPAPLALEDNKKKKKKDKKHKLSPPSGSSGEGGSPMAVHRSTPPVSPAVSVDSNYSSVSSSLQSTPSVNNTPTIGNSTGIPMEDAPLPKHSDVTYDFHIERYRLELIDNLTNSTSDINDSGFLFNGDGLHFGLTSNNVNFKPTNEFGEVYYSLPIREMIVSVVLNDILIQEVESFSKKIIKGDLCGHNDQSQKPVNKKYDPSITSISSDGISERIQIHHYHGPYLLKGNLILRKPIITDADPDPLKRLVSVDGKPLPPLIGLELNLHLSHFKLIGDRRAWKRFIAFIIPPDPDLETDSESDSSIIDPTVTNVNATTENDINNNNNNNLNGNTNGVGGDGSTSPQNPFAIKKSLVAKGKKKVSTFKRKFKLGENWKNQIKIILKASETLVVIPEEEEKQDSINPFKGSSTKILLGTFAMRNHSDWKSVPHLYEGLQLIDSNSNPDPITVSGLDHRFSFKMDNFTMNIVESNNTITIIQPASVSLYLRVSRSNNLYHEKRIPKIDISFISSDFNFRLTRYQSNYLDYVAKKYFSPQKMKSLMNSRMKSIKSLAKKRLQIMKNQKLDRTLTIKNKVEKTLQQYYWSVYINVQKGVFYLPLQHLLEPKKSRTEALLSELTLGGAQAGISEDLCEFKVEMLGMALQNKNDGQNVVFKVGRFEANGIEHPKLTTSTSLCPLPVPDDEVIPSRQSDATNLLVTYKRRPKALNSQLILIDNEMADWLTEVNVRLQGMQVKVIKKSVSGLPVEKKPKGLKIPDLQNFITKLVSTWQSKKDDIHNIKKGIQKVKLDIVWGVELGNCEILMGNKSKDKDVYFPKGTIRITDTNRKINARAYKDIEQELLKKTLDSAKSEMEKDDYNERINELEQQLESVKQQQSKELLQMKQEYMSLESKFIQTKMSLAEMEDEREALKFELKKYKK
ncbi:hypothetical protein DFA_00566 [Cavenderia fasciculata]|uniref:Chorein N-terminal domain-containing protein n=1 Tax=Cavenderia fasciculata TaxID=261658 RepID=F4PSL3_CACFS|nr:uncharacterized protein DFA_00566 [Cavenderia fasciculata]EGG20705.1 hypothetical protein DFA_00566 [Cavenderia fasciculata]|eukprot:XP_004358555.1 hypothetical protein DFA_00566 [Cavenderia fasciculata]